MELKIIKKQRRFYRLLFFTLLIFLLVIIGQRSEARIRYNNRTFVSIGETGLMFKAPKNMCFLDSSSEFDKPAYSSFKYIAEKNKKNILLAVFTKCENIAGDGGNINAEDIILNSGMVIWTPPSVEKKTPNSRKKYLNLRAKKFTSYVKRKLAHKDNQTLDKWVRRTKNTLALGASSLLQNLYGGKETNAVLAITLIKGIPLELILRNTKDIYIDMNDLYKEADNFFAAQIFINE